MEEWTKEETYHKITWTHPFIENIKISVRLNDVTRKYQVYANDGSIEIADLGTFGLRQEDLAISTANKWMQNFSYHQYMTTGKC
jgi:hypothetical protein